MIICLIYFLRLKESAYFDDDPPVPKQSEIVMPPCSIIIAKNSWCTLTIIAGKGLKRSYSWEGDTRSVTMIPRKERWYGSLGLYYPGPGNHWQEHEGITRGVLEEGQQHFKSIGEAIKWLNRHQPIVYRDDGLAVSFFKNPERHQLNVRVFQIYINGEKPSRIPGSKNADIKITTKNAN